MEEHGTTGIRSGNGVSLLVGVYGNESGDLSRDCGFVE